MKNGSSDVAMDQHIEALKSHHAENPEDERAYHKFAHDALGLAGAAKEHIIQERDAAAVALLIRNSDVRAAISKQDDRSQVEALKRIRSGESSGPEDDDNDENDRLLGPRAKRMPGHTRRRLVRD